MKIWNQGWCSVSRIIVSSVIFVISSFLCHFDHTCQSKKVETSEILKSLFIFSFQNQITWNQLHFFLNPLFNGRYWYLSNIIVLWVKFEFCDQYLGIRKTFVWLLEFPTIFLCLTLCRWYCSFIELFFKVIVWTWIAFPCYSHDKVSQKLN